MAICWKQEKVCYSAKNNIYHRIVELVWNGRGVNGNSCKYCQKINNEFSYFPTFFLG